MKKYKVVSDCLRWHKGTVIEQKRLAYSSHERFYAQGFGSPDHIPDSIMEELISRGLVEKIEEEKVKDYEVREGKAYFGSGEWAEITAVRRLSDGVEVKVGQDFTIYGYDTVIRKIISFEELNDGLRIVYDRGSCRLKYIQPLPEKKVLLTTEDGVKVYEGDSVITVNRESFYISKPPMVFIDNIPKEWVYFSTRDAAEEWVIKNKPNVFSWEDVSQAHHDPFDIMEYDEWIIMTGRKRLGFPQPTRDNRPRAKCPY